MYIKTWKQQVLIFANFSISFDHSEPVYELKHSIHCFYAYNRKGTCSQASARLSASRKWNKPNGTKMRKIWERRRWGKIINRSLSLSSAPVRFSHHFLLHDCTAILELGPDYVIGRGKG